MTLRARCPHCQQTQPIAAGIDTQSALSCSSCGLSYVPHKHLFVALSASIDNSVSPPQSALSVPAPAPDPSPPARPELATHRRALWIFISLLLALALLLQVASFKRDLWAAQWPALRSPLATWCSWVGCQISAPQELSSITVESSGFDQQDDGTFSLEIHLRHDQPYALATPAIELTLTDDFDRAVVRKFFLPNQLDLPAELPTGDGLKTQTRLQLNPDLQPHVSGFRIELFYP